MQTVEEFVKSELKRAKVKISKGKKITTSGCWVWGIKNNGNYSRIRIAGQLERAHRISMQIFKPDEYSPYMNVLHKCNNAPCFNPDHLYMGTQRENNLDQVKAGTHHNAKKTKCKFGHPYTPENTYVKKDGRRECWTCKRLRRI